ncbi:hypothetical protein Peur_016562 [Populus x canadensis]
MAFVQTLNYERKVKLLLIFKMKISYKKFDYYVEFRMMQTLTQFIVSYKVSEFNETEFEEYDPTAFGGGYDPAATYGKPLPPSDKICYPSSTPDPNALSLMVSPMDRLQHLTEKMKSMNLLRNLEVKGNR